MPRRNRKRKRKSERNASAPVVTGHGVSTADVYGYAFLPYVSKPTARGKGYRVRDYGPRRVTVRDVGEEGGRPLFINRF